MVCPDIWGVSSITYRLMLPALSYVLKRIRLGCESGDIPNSLHDYTVHILTEMVVRNL